MASRQAIFPCGPDNCLLEAVRVAAPSEHLSWLQALHQCDPLQASMDLIVLICWGKTKHRGYLRVLPSQAFLAQHMAKRSLAPVQFTVSLPTDVCLSQPQGLNLVLPPGLAEDPPLPAGGNWQDLTPSQVLPTFGETVGECPLCSGCAKLLSDWAPVLLFLQISLAQLCSAHLLQIWFSLRSTDLSQEVLRALPATVGNAPNVPRTALLFYVGGW